MHSMFTFMSLSRTNKFERWTHKRNLQPFGNKGGPKKGRWKDGVRGRKKLKLSGLAALAEGRADYF